MSATEESQRVIRVGLVGHGYWGAKHFRLLSQYPSCDLRWVCDTDPLKFEGVSGLGRNVCTYTDLNAALTHEFVEAVVIATPLRTHAALIRTCLNHNAHVLCEKPLVETGSEALSLGKSASERGLTLMAGHIFEYNDAIMHVREALLTSTEERLLYIHSKRTGWGPIRLDTGIIYDLACHDVSIVLMLKNELPTYVSAQGKSFFGKQTDLVQITLNFADGMTALILVSWLSPLKQRVLEVVTDRRMLVVDDVALHDRVKEVEWNPGAGVETADFSSFQTNVKAGSIRIPDISYREPLRMQLEHFLLCVRTGRKPRTDAGNAARVCQVLEALQESLVADGRKTELK